MEVEVEVLGAVVALVLHRVDHREADAEAVRIELGVALEVAEPEVVEEEVGEAHVPGHLRILERAHDLDARGTNANTAPALDAMIQPHLKKD